MENSKIAKYSLFGLIVLSVLLLLYLFIDNPAQTHHIHTVYARNDTVNIPQYVIDSVVSSIPSPQELSFIEKHGGIIISGVVAGFNIIIGLLITYLLTNKTTVKATEYELSHHPVFTEMELLLSREINQFSFGSEGRTELFRFLFKTQIQTLYNHLQQYIKQDTKYTYATDLDADINKLLAEAFNDYEAQCKCAEVPEMVIRRFGEVQESRVEILYTDVNHIIYDRVIDSYNSIKYEILSAIARHIRLTVMEDVQETLRSLNGELKKQKFRGKTL